MSYRDELEAQRAQVEVLRRELERSEGQLERARAALASVVADLAGLPAEAEIPWRSLHGGEPVTVRFVNATQHKLELVWVSYDGQLRPRATLVAEGERDEATYVAHLWRLVDPGGAVVMQRYVRAGETRLVAG